MAQSSWPDPAASRVITDVQHERLAARFSDNGIYGDPTDAAVVTAGVGLSVDIRANVYASVRGHGWTSGSTGDNLPVSANASGATRIDRVVLRLDRATWTVRAVIREGTPGSGAPTLVQDVGDTGVYEVTVAKVTVPNGATSVVVDRQELWVGSRLRPATSTTRNESPERGELVYENDTGITRQWTGTSWKTVVHDSGVIDVNSPLSSWGIGTGSILEARNGNVHFRLGSFERTAGSLAGEHESRLPVLIPAAYRHPDRDRMLIVYVTGGRIGRAIVFSAASNRPGQVWLAQHPTMATGDSILGSSVSWVV